MTALVAVKPGSRATSCVATIPGWPETPEVRAMAIPEAPASAAVPSHWASFQVEVAVSL
jgi:hypothetical protein